MNVNTFFDFVQSQSWYEDQIVHCEWLPPREAIFGELKHPLPALLQTALARMGIEQLYSHQAQTLNAARAGRDVVVATSTASGKTLCYNLPVLETVLDDFRNRALYLFPTKALAQDQLRSLGKLTAGGGALAKVRFGTYDGDTPQAQRTALRHTGHIILTNPDMLHLGILPNHPLWSRLLERLRYVVIDEAHVYRGVFGSHVANVLRRLVRLCDFYGSRPTFICASATIANPAEHIERLTSFRPVVVGDDGAPHGPRTFALWNPPALDSPSGEMGGAGHRSPNSEAANLMVALVEEDLRAIVFTRARKVAELILLYARRQLQARRPELASRIAAYRAGYLAEQRREIERGLFGGDLLAVTATNALELGIDIGELDAAVLVGFPGTIASTWQQAGRAGRGRDPALAVLIAQDNPLDQYFMHHPEMLFDRPVEHALIDPGNVYILQNHLACAAFERPLTPADELLFGPGFMPEVEQLEALGVLEWRDDRWIYRPDDYPAEAVSIRSISPDIYSILNRAEGGALLETVEGSTAFQRIHPGAIYLHQAEAYLVEELDLERRLAWVRPTSASYYTQPRELTDVRIHRRWESRLAGTTTVSVGEVIVRSQVVGFRQRRHFSDEVLDEFPLALPLEEFETVGVWWEVSPGVAQDLSAEELDFAGGLHAAEHACIGLLPLFAMCDRWDIGGVSTVLHPDTGTPLICIYDGYPGGVGIAERGFELIESLWAATRQALQDCPCEDGCPACVQSPKCGNNNAPLDKRAAMLILETLLGS
ncbi:MAG TPA: DEAD/DEAH box helicase [Chloroflexi bacterium]|nr:DEAD/DEAH box helicase [Chloroflexota bacterium]